MISLEAPQYRDSVRRSFGGVWKIDLDPHEAAIGPLLPDDHIGVSVIVSCYLHRKRGGRIDAEPRTRDGQRP